MTFKLISTLFRVPVSKVLDQVLCFILGREFCHKNVFCIFWSSSTVTFGTLVIKFTVIKQREEIEDMEIPDWRAACGNSRGQLEK